MVVVLCPPLEDLLAGKKGYMTPVIAKEHVNKLWEKEGKPSFTSTHDMRHAGLRVFVTSNKVSTILYTILGTSIERNSAFIGRINKRC